MTKKVSYKTKRILIINLILLIMICCGLFLAYRFIDQTRTEVGGMVNQVKRSEDQSVAIVVNRALEQLREYDTVLDTFFVEQEDAVKFVEQIESLARNVDVTLSITKLKLEESKNKGSFGQILLDLKIKGSWTNVMNFIMLIENMPKAITIQNVSMAGKRGKKDGKEHITWDATMNIRAIVK